MAGKQLLLQVEKLPKGTWELCYRALFSENLAYYSFFSISAHPGVLAFHFNLFCP